MKLYNALFLYKKEFGVVC